MRALLTLCALWLCAACAHAPPAAPIAAPAATWPSPPATPRARLAGELPRDEAAEKPSWWRRGLSAFLGTEDRPGRHAALLVRPFGVASRGGDLLVADPDAASVRRFDWRRGTSQAVECSGREWAGPLAVALDPEGVVYVADGAAGRVVRVARDGRCLEIGADVLERPSGVAWSTGRIYVVDPPRHAVIAFGPDGRQLLRFGSRGEGEGQLNFPTAIAADPAGDLLLVDALNFRIVRFSPDGRALATFGQPGDVEGSFGRPKGVAADDRHVFVTDAQFDVVLVFSRSGRFEYLLGDPGVGPGELSMPAGIAVQGAHVFVASSRSGRIQIYELLGEAT